MRLFRRTIVLVIGLILALVYWIRPFPDSALGGFCRVMQAGSAVGAEWLMHCFNVPAWADGATLRMGFRSVIIDGRLSAAWVVLIAAVCTLGATLLYRRRWAEIIYFPVLAVVQVFVLNLVRIFLVAVRSLDMPPGRAQAFAARTHGLFMLAGIVFLAVEVLWWKKRRALHTAREVGREDGHVEHPDKATILPRFWQIVRVIWKPAILSVLVLGLVGFVIHKRRPAHRSLMIAEIADEIAVADAETAKRAMETALKLSPDSSRLKLKKAVILARLGKFQDALDMFESVPGDLAPDNAALKADVLLGLDRMDEAAAILDALPPGAKTMPETAIIAAECAVRRDMPEEAAKHVVAASKSRVLVKRVRGLFSYLASREQWQAIADSDDPDVAYDGPGQALTAIRAMLRAGESARAAQGMRSAVAKWPDEPSLLPDLAALALEQSRAEWEQAFERSYLANLPRFDVGGLHLHIRHCFRLNRPDLAWQGYLQLGRKDPRDPALWFIPARFGRRWFEFRKRRLGTGAADERETVDLAPLFAQTRNLEPFKTLCRQIPLADELLEAQDSSSRHFLDQCLAELERREVAGKLPLRMSVMYGDALAQAGRYEQAHARLDRIQRELPEIKNRILLKHAVLYSEQGLWQEAYEALTGYRSLTAAPDPGAGLFFVKVLMNLNLGICAADAVEQLKETFPGSIEASIAEAAVWEFFGADEEALFLLGRIEQLKSSRILPELLDRTGRFSAAERMRRALGMTGKRGDRPFRQVALLPRAELLVDPERWEAGSDRDVELEAATSPFIRDLGRLVAEWSGADGGRGSSAVGRWRDVGRNDMEKGASLYHLSVLLARGGRFDEAAAAVAAAIEFMPNSAVLWRMRIRLTGGDAGVIEEARRGCPYDPGIWLGWLVVHARDRGAGEWAAAEMARVVKSREYSPATMVQAGDFLLRKGMVEAATIAAEDAIGRGGGFLPAHVLGLRCALASDDLERAAVCAVQCAENSLSPWPYRKALVDIKLASGSIDPDLVVTLEALREKFPDRFEFSEKLARACLARGDIDRAEKLIAGMVKNDPQSPAVNLLLLAAETARQQGKTGEAVQIMRTGRRLYPGSVAILNNLVYYLAQGPETVTEAEDLLPGLLESEGDTVDVLDTAAVVELKGGQPSRAWDYMAKAPAGFGGAGHSAYEINLNAAEILFELGREEEARERLDAARAGMRGGRGRILDQRLKELLEGMR